MTRFLLTLLLSLSACQALADVVVAAPEDVRPAPDLYGKGPEPDMDLPTLRQKADSGDPRAQNDLGRRYGTGDGVAKDSELSFRYYSLSAAQGLSTGQCNLAFMYAEGEGTNQDIGKALQWYSACAQQGHFLGEYALGRMYALGIGVEKNGALAEKWFLLAANQGFVQAQEALLHMYTQGDGIPKDSDKAVMWLHRVRDANHFGRVWKQQAR